jgi:hypothetical protein
MEGRERETEGGGRERKGMKGRERLRNRVPAIKVISERNDLGSGSVMVGGMIRGGLLFPSSFSEH